MGGKNRAKKKVNPVTGVALGKKKVATNKNKAAVKVQNKTANKARRTSSRHGAESEKSQSKAAAKHARKVAGVTGKGDGMNAEERKKAKKSHGAKMKMPSVKQMKQHAHEPRGMAKHDAAYNARQQAKANKASQNEDEDADAELASDSEPAVNEADADFFADHEDIAGFLDNLNADDLTWAKKKDVAKELQRQKEIMMKRQQQRDENEDDEDDDLGDDDGDSAGGESDDESDDGVSKYERGLRRPGWQSSASSSTAASSSIKERLPVKQADGSWGVSDIAKADALRERAKRLEEMQKMKERQKQIQHDDDDDDEEMDDAEFDDEAEASDEEEDEDEVEDEEDEEDMHYDLDASDDDVAMSDVDDDEDEELEMEEVNVQPSNALAQQQKLKEQQERRRFRLKAELAESSELILEDPERHIGKLEPMLQLCHDGDLIVQQLALMSCVEVLVDLMPTYRIRMPSAEELESNNISKEVKATWKYERSYLLYYGRLVTALLDGIKSVFTKDKNDRLAVPAYGLNLLRCACKLLEHGYAFNYRKELVQSLTPFLNHVSPLVRDVLLRTLINIFRADISGEATLEMVRILARIVKEKGRRVNNEVMQIFLYLPLHKEILQAQVEEKKTGPLPKKKKKKGGVSVDDKALAKDLGESDATVSLAIRKRIQTQLLTELFTCYFRILKQQRTARILPLVLKGLSKFATLIDIDLVLDLLDCLKATIKPDADEPLNLESSLYCILTAFNTLRAHGQAVSMDLKEFYNCLYALIFRFCDPTEVCHVPLLLQCLDVMFHETKQLSLERVASFVKRLSNVCLYVPPYAALAIMHAVRLCLNKYPKVKQLLDREVSASGVHLWEIDDPDLANSFASSTFELGLLKSSYHPFVPVYASSILEDEPLPLVLSRITPTQLFDSYDTSEGGFNPPLPTPQILVTGSDAATPTSTTMKKKLDLRRRMLLQQLAATQRNEQFWSPFMRTLTRESRKRRREEEEEQAAARTINMEQLHQRLERLQQVSQQAKKRRKQHAASKQAATPSTKKKQKLHHPTSNGKLHKSAKLMNGSVPG